MPCERVSTKQHLNFQLVNFCLSTATMRVLSLIALPLLASAAVLKRDAAADINTAVGYISSNLTQVDKTLSGLGYNDTITGIFLLFQTQGLQDAVSNAQTVIEASPALDDAQSGSVSIPLTQVATQTINFLNHLVSKKPQLQTAFLGGNADFLVKFNLQSSQDKVEGFGTAITSKLSATYASLAPQVIGQITAAFNTAIEAFSD